MNPNFQTLQARRRLIAAATAVLCAALVITSCGKNTPTVQNEEPAAAKAPMVSILKMNDPSAKDQLVRGVYGLESGMWRWTGGNFEVVLKTPPGAAQKGATLTLALVASDALLKELHSQSLSAAIGSKTLKTEKYLDPGAHTFSADVPAALLAGDTVVVDFTLDNALPPGPTDRRELGVIVTSVGLETN